jgi:hypothetical protein
MEDNTVNLDLTVLSQLLADEAPVLDHASDAEPVVVNNAATVDTDPDAIIEPTTVLSTDNTPAEPEGLSDDAQNDNNSSSNIEEIYSTLTSALGFELSEEELGEIEMGSDAETTAQIATVLANKAAINAVESLYNAYPEIERLKTHLDAYGTLDGFNQKTDNSPSLELNIGTTEGQRDAYSKYLQAQGIEEDEIEALVDLAEDTNKLEAKSITAKNFFELSEEKAREESLAEARKTIEERELHVQQIKEEVTSVISSGNILGVQLTPADKKGLQDFLFKPADEHGNSASDLADREMSLEKELYLKYLVYKDFKGLTAKSNPQVKTLQDMFKKNEGRVPTAGIRQSGSKIELPSMTSVNIDESAIRAQLGMS